VWKGTGKLLKHPEAHVVASFLVWGKLGSISNSAPLDALGVEDLARILQSTKRSLIQQFRKLVRFHGADLCSRMRR
jgi:ATP-dependent protease Clp ATPase subunit